MANKVSLTEAQRSELVSQFVDIVVDGMDMKSLVQYVTDDLEHFYENRCDDIELKEFIDNHDDELYDELVDNVTNETVLDVNNNGGKFY